MKVCKLLNINYFRLEWVQFRAMDEVSESNEEWNVDNLTVVLSFSGLR